MERLVRRAVSLLLIWLIAPVVFAQDSNRYMVFFTDKANSPFSISSPSGFLSAKALSRRTKNSVSIDESDLPVNENYVIGIEGLGANAFFRTKWLNGVLTEMSETLVASVEALPYVDRVEFVAPGVQLFDEEQDHGPPGDPIVIAPGEEVRTEFQNQLVGIDDMHSEGNRGEGVLIAVVDSGFPNLDRIDAFDHLFDQNRILLTKDFTFNQEYIATGSEHGLRVLSILAGVRDDFVGVAPNASYLLFITEDSRPGREHRVEEYNWLFSAEKADSAGVDIITTSVGYSEFIDDTMDYTYDDMNGNVAVISRAAGMAFSKGIVVLTSAGNQGNTDWLYITAPADHPDVLAVGSVNIALNKATTSSIGPNSDGVIKPDVVAFGSGTSTILQSGNISPGSGTSFAAPIVAGLAAGLIQALPELTHAEIADVIRASGNQVTSPDNDLGYGIPDYSRAIDIVDQPTVPEEDGLLVYPNPTSQSIIFLSFSADKFDVTHQVKLISFGGRVISETEVTPNVLRSKITIDWTHLPPGMYVLQVLNSNQKYTRKLIKY